MQDTHPDATYCPANIPIPSLPNETPKAYASFCEYVRMGDERSIETLLKAVPNLSHFVTGRTYHLMHDI